MGIITSCCKPSASDVLTPDTETRRRQQVEAAERRRAQEASRGVKDPERVKRMQQRAEEMEQREQELAKQGGATLKWSAE
ncbi:small VCP/p97-interacting protein [Zerene cesonia]|uniref:small VCP/p97-interacting protein n=1 Tax=Zerene cesonia TaxID=33412 RepID=UPI0018E5189A|nr:small VCP/p97-interacting protein [Zerene cesonia]